MAKLRVWYKHWGSRELKRFQALVKMAVVLSVNIGYVEGSGRINAG